MKHYEIKPSKRRIVKLEFMWRDLELDNLAADIYSLILFYGAYQSNVCGNESSLCSMTGVCEGTIRGRLKSMVENGVLAVRKVRVAEKQYRNVYAAIYDENGKRDKATINSLLDEGERSLIEYYCQPKTYKRGHKKRRAKKTVAERFEEAFWEDLSY